MHAGTLLVREERYGGLDEAGRATVLASPQSTEAFLRARVQTER